MKRLVISLLVAVMLAGPLASGAGAVDVVAPSASSPEQAAALIATLADGRHAVVINGLIITGNDVERSHCPSQDVLCQVLELNSRIDQAITGYYVYLLDRRDDFVANVLPTLIAAADIYTVSTDGVTFLNSVSSCTDVLDLNVAFCELAVALNFVYYENGEVTSLSEQLAKAFVSFAFRTTGTPSYCIIPQYVCPPPTL